MRKLNWSGKRLRKFRLEAGYTQQYMAYHSNLSNLGYWSLESGRRYKPQIQSVISIAATLKISVDKLLGGL